MDISALIQDALVQELNEAITALAEFVGSADAKKHIETELRPNAKRVVERGMTKLAKLVDLNVDDVLEEYDDEHQSRLDNGSLDTALVELEKLDIERRRLVAATERAYAEARIMEEVTVKRQRRVQGRLESALLAMNKILQLVEVENINHINRETARLVHIGKYLVELSAKLQSSGTNVLGEEGEQHDLASTREYEDLYARLGGGEDEEDQ